MSEEPKNIYISIRVNRSFEVALVPLELSLKAVEFALNQLEPDGTIELKKVEMPEEQYEKLKPFEGFIKPGEKKA